MLAQENLLLRFQSQAWGPSPWAQWQEEPVSLLGCTNMMMPSFLGPDHRSKNCASPAEISTSSGSTIASSCSDHEYL